MLTFATYVKYCAYKSCLQIVTLSVTLFRANDFRKDCKQVII